MFAPATYNNVNSRNQFQQAKNIHSQENLAILFPQPVSNKYISYKLKNISPANRNESNSYGKREFPTSDAARSAADQRIHKV
jgi:hypothetical protein